MTQRPPWLHASQRWVVAAFALAACSGLAAMVAPRSVDASALVGRLGSGPVSTEELLLVWDEASHTEHLIHRAFAGPWYEEFALLVPTPTRPEIAEVDASLWTRVFELYRRPPPPPRDGMDALGGGQGLLELQVIAERHLTGMDATVLVARDRAALDAWLAAHGCRSGPGLTDYLAPYVTAGWFITVFRIAPGAVGEGRFSTASVRLSFSSERPFVPYSEPRLLLRGRTTRVSVVAPFRVAGYLDSPVGGQRSAWSIGAGFAGRPSGLPVALQGVLPNGMRAGPWLTTFEESRRPGGLDLFFERAPSQRPQASTIRVPMTP